MSTIAFVNAHQEEDRNHITLGQKVLLALSLTK